MCVCVCVISTHSDDKCEQNILYSQCFDINGCFISLRVISQQFPARPKWLMRHSIESILKSTQLGFGHRAEVNVAQTQTATHRSDALHSPSSGYGGRLLGLAVPWCPHDPLWGGHATFWLVAMVSVHSWRGARIREMNNRIAQWR